MIGFVISLVISMACVASQTKQHRCNMVCLCVPVLQHADDGDGYGMDFWTWSAAEHRAGDSRYDGHMSGRIWMQADAEYRGTLKSLSHPVGSGHRNCVIRKFPKSFRCLGKCGFLKGSESMSIVSPSPKTTLCLMTYL